MENADFFNNSIKLENSHKMDIEQAHNFNHANIIKNYIFSKRAMNAFPFNQKSQNGIKTIDQFNSNLILKKMDEIILISDKIHNCSPQSITKNGVNSIKNIIYESLKQIRKELSKENISLIEAKNIFCNKTHKFIELFLNGAFDPYDPYVQIECLWIINNLMFLIAKYNDCIFYDVKIISNSLIQYLINIYKNQQNEGVKNTLIEKILRIFGNLIQIDNSIIKILINNQIFSFIINSLNNPVSSFRTTCLWLINKVILILKKLDETNYINIFMDNNSISNFKFILSRIDKQRSFDEIGELFWLFNELVKYNPSILVPIFFYEFSKLGNNMDNNSLFILNKELALKNFEFVLDNCLTLKTLQTCFRLISNLLIVCYNIVNNEDLLSKFIERLFLKKNILNFINEVLNSPKNKYEISLVKDILLLIFNLIYLSQVKSCALFKYGIVNIINNKYYQNDNEIMKLLFFIYYRIIASNSFLFDSNDEKVIRTCLIIMERFKDDNSILIIFIDILYFYLKTSNIKIGEDIENELNRMSKSMENIPIENLQDIIIKLINFVKIHPLLSRFMK